MANGRYYTIPGKAYYPKHPKRGRQETLELCFRDGEVLNDGVSFIQHERLSLAVRVSVADETGVSDTVTLPLLPKYFPEELAGKTIQVLLETTPDSPVYGARLRSGEVIADRTEQHALDEKKRWRYDVEKMKRVLYGRGGAHHAS